MVVVVVIVVIALVVVVWAVAVVVVCAIQGTADFGTHKAVWRFRPPSKYPTIDQEPHEPVESHSILMISFIPSLFDE